MIPVLTLMAGLSRTAWPVGAEVANRSKQRGQLPSSQLVVGRPHSGQAAGLLPVSLLTSVPLSSSRNWRRSYILRSATRSRFEEGSATPRPPLPHSPPCARLRGAAPRHSVAATDAPRPAPRLRPCRGVR